MQKWCCGLVLLNAAAKPVSSWKKQASDFPQRNMQKSAGCNFPINRRALSCWGINSAFSWALPNPSPSHQRRRHATPAILLESHGTQLAASGVRKDRAGENNATQLMHARDECAKRVGRKGKRLRARAPKPQTVRAARRGEKVVRPKRAA
jgi:hypothetical protein